MKKYTYISIRVNETRCYATYVNLDDASIIVAEAKKGYDRDLKGRTITFLRDSMAYY